jgi:Rrf2 family protein
LKLQTATSLALVSVLEAAANPARTVSAADIADKYGVSIHHLAKVLRELARAGVVESARGVGGGYRFTGNVKRLTLMDVIERFEDISSRSPEGGRTTTDAGRALARILAEIDDTAKATFRSVTIDTMLKLMARERGAAAGTPRAAKVARQA